MKIPFYLTSVMSGLIAFSSSQAESLRKPDLSVDNLKATRIINALLDAGIDQETVSDTLAYVKARKISCLKLTIGETFYSCTLDVESEDTDKSEILVKGEVAADLMVAFQGAGVQISSEDLESQSLTLDAVSCFASIESKLSFGCNIYL